MRILLLGINYAPEPVGIGPYTTGLAQALVRAGHDVRVIAGKPYYPQWKVPEAFRRFGYMRSVEQGVTITRCPHYVPASPSGSRRILHHLSFALSALPQALGAALRFRPQLVMTIAPSLIGAPVARLAAGVAGAGSWLHIQDFEVEAAFATGLIGETSAIARAALRFQDWALRGFDRVSSISPQMCAKLATFGVRADRIVQFRNWSDLSKIRVLDGPSPYRAEWGIDRPVVALYSGNIANKQGIDIIVDAARLLRHRDDIQFLICGEGPQKAQLIEKAADLPNVRFEPLQPMERLGDLVGLASLHLLPQLAGAADLVLPSKLTNMLASGRPVIATADPGTGLADEVEGCGIVVPPGDAAAFAGAIAALADDPARRSALGQAARVRAEERWSSEAILGDLLARMAALTPATRRD
jgi:colanic acid biosynthesis glycosyl transferase WcaI